MKPKKKDLEKIIIHYGVKNQTRKFAEESYELIEALLLNDYFSSRRKNIIEEIADVTVMLRQFCVHFHIDEDEINEIACRKVERQMKRIEEEGGAE